MNSQIQQARRENWELQSYPMHKGNENFSYTEKIASCLFYN